MSQKLIRTYVLTIPTSGSAGSATGSFVQGGINGVIEGIYVDVTQSVATRDITFTASNPSRAILTLTDFNTDGYIPLRVQAKDPTGAAITGVYEREPVDGSLTVAIAQSNASTTGDVVVYVYVIEG